MSLLDKKSVSPGSIFELFPIALPIFLSQLIDVSMIFCDRYFLSKLGKEDLAATFSGGLFTFFISTFLIGTLGQVTPLVGQYIGAGQPKRAVSTLHQGFIAAIIFVPIVVVLSFYFSPPLFELLNHSTTLLDREVKYFKILSFTLITSSLRIVLANFFVGIGKTKIVTFASFFAVIANIPLTYGMVFGELGFPKMGIEGAGIATLLASILPVLILGFYFLKQEYRIKYETNFLIQYDSKIMRQLLRYGLPSGLEMQVNLTGFLFFTMVMYSYSSDVAAATTIVLNWDMICFVPLMGISQAVGGQIGKYLGQKEKSYAWKSAWSALKLAWIYACLITVVYFTWNHFLIGLFAPIDPNIDFTIVKEYASLMLKISCIYFVFDSTYTVLGGILRGSGDTVWPMFVSNVVMWACAFSVYFFKKYGEFTPIHSWMMLTGMVITLGILYSHRFLQKNWMNRLMIGKELIPTPNT